MSSVEKSESKAFYSLDGSYDEKTQELTIGNKTIQKVAQETFSQRFFHFFGYSLKISVKVVNEQRTFYVPRSQAKETFPELKKRPWYHFAHVE